MQTDSWNEPADRNHGRSLSEVNSARGPPDTPGAERPERATERGQTDEQEAEASEEIPATILSLDH